MLWNLWHYVYDNRSRESDLKIVPGVWFFWSYSATLLKMLLLTVNILTVTPTEKFSMKAEEKVFTPRVCHANTQGLVNSVSKDFSQ